MELSIKLNREEKDKYIAISQQIWGCVPIDVIWAKETSIYKQAEEKYVNERRSDKVS